jgi:hypothetical protein
MCTNNSSLQIPDIIYKYAKKLNYPNPQCKAINNYCYFTPPIGTGAFSKVYIGYKIEPIELKKVKVKYIAIKRIGVLSLKKMSLERINREIKLLESLNHVNIVKYHETFTDSSGNIYIVIDYW